MLLRLSVLMLLCLSCFYCALCRFDPQLSVCLLRCCVPGRFGLVQALLCGLQAVTCVCVLSLLYYDCCVLFIPWVVLCSRLCLCSCVLVFVCVLLFACAFVVYCCVCKFALLYCVASLFVVVPVVAVVVVRVSLVCDGSLCSVLLVCFQCACVTCCR